MTTSVLAGGKLILSPEGAEILSERNSKITISKELFKKLYAEVYFTKRSYLF